MDYGEEEQFRNSGAFSGNYDLDIIQEYPDDEIEASGSKQGSPPQGDTKLEDKHGDKMQKRPTSKGGRYLSQSERKKEDQKTFLKQMQTKSEKESLKKLKTKKTVIAERSLVNK